jgi:hypothetical protein
MGMDMDTGTALHSLQATDAAQRAGRVHPVYLGPHFGQRAGDVLLP